MSVSHTTCLRTRLMLCSASFFFKETSVKCVCRTYVTIFPLITFLILSLGDEKMFLISPEINLCVLSYESSQILFDSNVAHM